MKRIAALLLLLFALACEREEKPKPAIAEPNNDHERGNLLLIPRGASVFSRTAENSLPTSAAHALDGDRETQWQTLPGDASQTVIVSLAARSRITRLGAITSEPEKESPQQLRVAASDDGATWRDAATVNLKPSKFPHIVDVPPFEARYLRIAVVEPRDSLSIVRTFVAYGSAIEPATPPSLDGCWSINGTPSRFVQRGSSVSGVIGDMLVTGGSDGGAFRLMWRKGSMWGHAIAAVDPSRRAMSGLLWHEDVINFRGAGEGWFGTPARCGDASIDEIGTAAAVMQRAGYWTIYGDAALDTAAALIAARDPSRRFRAVARDAARMNAVRAGLQSRGVDLGRIDFEIVPVIPANESQRALADGVSLYAR